MSAVIPPSLPAPDGSDAALPRIPATGHGTVPLFLVVTPHDARMLTPADYQRWLHRNDDAPDPDARVHVVLSPSLILPAEVIEENHPDGTRRLLAVRPTRDRSGWPEWRTLTTTGSTNGEAIAVTKTQPPTPHGPRHFRTWNGIAYGDARGAVELHWRPQIRPIPNVALIVHVPGEHTRPCAAKVTAGSCNHYCLDSDHARDLAGQWTAGNTRQVRDALQHAHATHPRLNP